MPDPEQEARKTLADSPKDTASGAVKPRSGPLDRAGTEAEAAAQGDRTPPKPDDGPPAGRRNAAFRDDPLERPGEEAGRDTERAAAYRENDA